MGAGQSTVTAPDEAALRESLETQPTLQNFSFDVALVPGSGRFTRTHRLKHKSIETTAVCKSMWIAETTRIETQREELERIKRVLKGQPHVAPFTAWFIGEARRPQLCRPIFVLRPHFYTTLSDRLTSRPWMHHVEKVWVAAQILDALQHMHEANVVHGFLTTENVGLTSHGWVVLLDIASYKSDRILPDDDPTEYMYYFHPLQHAEKTREKRCYLAPERFYTPSSEILTTNVAPTSASDIFSTGCVLTELFINGERCMDLGDLMEYRRQRTMTSGTQQKLNKIESSHLRAACRHMLNLNPEDRLSALAYRERLEATEQIPPPLKRLTKLVERLTTSYSTPDARVALMAAEYPHVLWETMGMQDTVGCAYFARVMGPVMLNQLPESTSESPTIALLKDSKKTSLSAKDALFAETEELLKQLESLDFEGEEDSVESSDLEGALAQADAVKIDEGPPSPLSQASLLIYLQSVLSTVRHVQRPSSKLVALQLVNRISRCTSDEARMQRIVPVAISLLHDQDALVRASSLRLLAFTLSIIQTFPPSDSNVFSEYVFKKVAHMITDPCLNVRLVFAESVVRLAETAHRFLDITHAVRLYEAVGSGPGSGLVSEEANSSRSTLFADDITKLLDTSESDKPATERMESSLSSDSGQSETALMAAGKIMINSTYDVELSALHEIVSRWVVHITTDQSEHSSLPKRALLKNLGALCNFFGLDGVMAFILPQILAFLNDRKDRELRSSLFQHLPYLCGTIGRAATEEFVLPCVEIGLVDCEEMVVADAIACLRRLVEMNLISRSVLLGAGTASTRGGVSLLERYAPLLMHPCCEVRKQALDYFASICGIVGSPDSDVYVYPILLPFLRYRATREQCISPDALKDCVKLAWTRKSFDTELERLMSVPSFQSAGTWTTVSVSGGLPHRSKVVQENKQSTLNVERIGQFSVQENVSAYFRMLARHTTQTSNQDLLAGQSISLLPSGIQGSVKSAQSVMFPRHNAKMVDGAKIPEWYAKLRDSAEGQHLFVSETSAIRSVSTLGHVYGLSIMGPSHGETGKIVGAADGSNGNDETLSSYLKTGEAKSIEAANLGEWGSEVLLDPELVDTTLLVTKLKAMNVPPLPLDLGDQFAPVILPVPIRKNGGKQGVVQADWRPRTNALIASSTISSGHTAPVVRLAVSLDSRFFVSASHDGSCRVWETQKAEQSVGILESSLVYKDHSITAPVRINDIAMVEGSHSLFSGDSGGSLHVWRVDMVESSAKPSFQGTLPTNLNHSKVVGSSNVRKVDAKEGEVLALSHFNTISASLLAFATQSGAVHSWDLRCSKEPFVFKHTPDFGLLTSMSIGSDRQYIVTGTSRGYLALWDVRFQQPVKVWQHSRRAPIHRLATSFVPPPQMWTSRVNESEARPFLFVASGPNETGMFDMKTGSCMECFRSFSSNSLDLQSELGLLPTLNNIDISRRSSGESLGINCQRLRDTEFVSSKGSIHCMVGSIGASHQSFLVTGGSDCRIRFWDFSDPSKCFTLAGQEQGQNRPYFERIDLGEGKGRLIACRDAESGPAPSHMSRKLHQGVKRPDHHHTDSIQDLKIIDGCSLISCSRDSTIKMWR